MVFENDKIQSQIKNFNGLDLFSVPGLIIDLRKQPQNQFVITFYAPITSSFQLCSGFFATCVMIGGRWRNPHFAVYSTTEYVDPGHGQLMPLTLHSLRRINVY